MSTIKVMEIDEERAIRIDNTFGIKMEGGLSLRSRYEFNYAIMSWSRKWRYQEKLLGFTPEYEFEQWAATRFSKYTDKLNQFKGKTVEGKNLKDVLIWKLFVTRKYRQ